MTIELPRTPTGEIDWTDFSVLEEGIIIKLLWTTANGPRAVPFTEVLRAIHEDGQRVGQEKMREQAVASCDAVFETWHEQGGRDGKIGAHMCAVRIRKLEIEP